MKKKAKKWEEGLQKRANLKAKKHAKRKTNVFVMRTFENLYITKEEKSENNSKYVKNKEKQRLYNK